MTEDNLVRVTQVLDYFAEPGLVDWKVKVGKREAKKISTVATKIGTNVDDWIKAKIAGSKLPKLKSIEAENCVKAFERWWNDYKPSLTVGERLSSEPFQITGEPDLYWDDVVIDIKCSASIRKKYWLQTAAYCKLSRRDKRAILRLDKNLGEYEYKQKDGCAEDWVVFLALLTAYLYFNPPMAETKEVGNANDTREGKELSLPTDKEVGG